ncbi:MULTISPECIES: MarR family EPS-associated transcriptional regulator [unclassified Sphingomonas]|uniref:MarR family EPS-associated transcriptional regulator n=1 Tax=Sphingomonas TaxID=13687 RepID=UPI000964850C|nr:MULTISPECIES: MarR family EPS-associated transcriptional regulator [unclassified Sphingomonas]MBN8811840.1 MarR family EPS-associated transcriptional regulator [Sphingomonas sp.]OJY52798.1 MAG: MarR family EPS-associated transcriptional regulator [Sphingomonas sp. 67-41]
MAGARQDHNREDVRFRVLRLLEEHPEYSQRDIAHALGVSLGSVNYCLGALIEMGHVKLGNFRSSSNKLRYMYVLTPKGISEKVSLTSRFLQRKLAEYEALRAEIEALTGSLNNPPHSVRRPSGGGRSHQANRED